MDKVSPAIEAVSSSPIHSMAKRRKLTIRLIEGLGVEGDAHAGTIVKHRSRVRQNAAAPNLRQVHLIQAELHDELRASGFDVNAGSMGENITTRGIDLLALPSRTLLHIGEHAVVQLTGLRNPCQQLEGIQSGLMQAVLARDPAGNLVRKAGIMVIVVSGGEVHAGDSIRVELPSGEHKQLEPV